MYSQVGCYRDSQVFIIQIDNIFKLCLPSKQIKHILPPRAPRHIPPAAGGGGDDVDVEYQTRAKSQSRTSNLVLLHPFGTKCRKINSGHFQMVKLEFEALSKARFLLSEYIVRLICNAVAEMQKKKIVILFFSKLLLSPTKSELWEVGGRKHGESTTTTTAKENCRTFRISRHWTEMGTHLQMTVYSTKIDSVKSP